MVEGERGGGGGVRRWIGMVEERGGGVGWGGEWGWLRREEEGLGREVGGENCRGWMRWVGG